MKFHAGLQTISVLMDLQIVRFVGTKVADLFSSTVIAVIGPISSKCMSRLGCVSSSMSVLRKVERLKLS